MDGTSGINFDNGQYNASVSEDGSDNEDDRRLNIDVRIFFFI